MSDFLNAYCYELRIACFPAPGRNVSTAHANRETRDNHQCCQIIGQEVDSEKHKSRAVDESVDHQDDTRHEKPHHIVEEKHAERRLA